MRLSDTTIRSDLYIRSIQYTHLAFRRWRHPESENLVGDRRYTYRSDLTSHVNFFVAYLR
jgi:hypothetical protein